MENKKIYDWSFDFSLRSKVVWPWQKLIRVNCTDNLDKTIMLAAFNYTEGDHFNHAGFMDQVINLGYR